jgi:hypothetical protein
VGTWWVVTNNACMGHSDRVNKRVHETGGMRWAGRDTMDETDSPAVVAGTDDASNCYSWKPFLDGTDFGLPPPLTRFQSPHLTENTCHEKSDFYIIIMIIAYVS